MFNLGFTEIIAIGIIALIFIGPKQLPALAKSLGHMMREFKKATAELSGGLLEIKEDLTKPVKETLNAMNDAEQTYHSEEDHAHASVTAESTNKAEDEPKS